MAAKKKTKKVAPKPAELPYEGHKTKKIAVKYGEIDEGIVPVIKWLNSLPGVITWYCCEGNTEEERKRNNGYGGDTYVLFQCTADNDVSLVKILSATKEYADIVVDFYNGFIRYRMGFLSKEGMFRFIEKEL